MRIIGGTLRGLKLADPGPGDPEAHLRPTTDRVRESIFNLLVNGGHGRVLPQARVLDLFAGTGAMGLEALSRGADHASFVENGPIALKLLRANLDKTRSSQTAQILRADATLLKPNAGPPFTLVFLDPPYGRSLGERAMASALQGGWIGPGAIVVWEEARPPVIPGPLCQIDQRKYGSSLITLARLAATDL